MNNERLATLIAVLIVISVFIVSGLSYFVYVAYYNYERYRPQIIEPLKVEFKVATGNGDYKYVNVGIENNKIAIITLPISSRLEFTYLISCHAPRVANNVTLFLDYVSDKLQFIDDKNQTYPYTNDVGTMETNAVIQYSTILETPATPGLYHMNWHITSDQTAYAFVIYVNVIE